MAVRTYTNRDGELRLYDGSGTPYYLVLPFVNGNFTCPWGRGRPDEIVVMNRGRMRNTDSFWHYIQGPDDPIAAPLQLTFSIRIANSSLVQRVRQVLNVDSTSAWTVGANTWVTTKGTTQVLSGGRTPVLVTTPTFADPRKRCFNVEVLFTDPDYNSSVDIGYRYAECYAAPQNQRFAESNDMIEVSCQVDCHGANSEISAFTAGTQQG